jgi:hypothetical protein
MDIKTAVVVIIILGIFGFLIGEAALGVLAGILLVALYSFMK